MTHLSEWLKLKRLTLTSVSTGKDMNNWSSNTLLVGMQTHTATMENSIEIPLKTMNKTTIQTSNPTTGHIP